MGKLLCEKNVRDVWCRNESVRAEIGPILQTHTHTRARARARVSYSIIDLNHYQNNCWNFFRLFSVQMCFLCWIFLFAINWHWNFKVMTPFHRSCSKTYVQKPILWKSLEYVPRYFTVSNFLFWQWLPWKQAIFSKCSMMPAWHHSDSWCGRSWDA